MDQSKSSRSPCIQLFVQNGCLRVFKIAVCDKVQCNDGAQGTRKISFIKKIELDNWQSKVFWESRKLLEQGGYQGFFKVQIVMSSTAWKVSKYRVISGPYFPVFVLNTDQKQLRIWTPFTQWSIVATKRRLRKKTVTYMALSIWWEHWSLKG